MYGTYKTNVFLGQLARQTPSESARICLPRSSCIAAITARFQIDYCQNLYLFLHSSRCSILNTLQWEAFWGGRLINCIYCVVCALRRVWSDGSRRGRWMFWLLMDHVWQVKYGSIMHKYNKIG